MHVVRFSFIDVANVITSFVLSDVSVAELVTFVREVNVNSASKFPVAIFLGVT